MAKQPMNAGLMIGEASRQSGLHVETIRYYERIGLVPAPMRTSGQHRLYEQSQMNRLIFIKRSRDLGFSLTEVRALLTLIDGEDMTCEQVHRITIDHIENVRRKLTDLRRLERALKELAGQCSKGNVPECPIVDTLYGGA